MQRVRRLELPTLPLKTIPERKIMFEKIIEHQVNLMLEEKGIKNCVSDCEKLRYKYDIALKLLEELS